MSRAFTAKLLARYFGLQYAHRKIEDFHGHYLDWDSFFGFWSDDLTCEQVMKLGSMKIVMLPEAVDMTRADLMLYRLIIEIIHPEDDVLFMIAGYSFLDVDEEKQLQKSYYQELRRGFADKKMGSPFRPCFESGKISVVAHIRRAEIEDLKKKGDWQGIWRWVDLHWYQAVLKNLERLFGKDLLQIRIYSDCSADCEGFQREFPGYDVRLRKDDKDQPYSAFMEASAADIFICAASGFSEFAAAFGRSVVLCPPNDFVRKYYFRQRLVQPERGCDWILCGRDGSFDEDLLRQRVAAAKRLNS